MMTLRARVFVLFALIWPVFAQAEIRSSAGALTVEAVVTGLEAPWAFGFINDGAGVVITQRDGRMFVSIKDALHEVSGLPDVVDRGQGGLLDVMVPRDFNLSREIFWTYAKEQERGEGTALARGVLSNDNRHLSDVRLLWELAPGSSGGRHFGSRIVEGADGHLYLSIGDRGDRPSAQDLSNENGSIVRLSRDGSIPDDNPFVGRSDARAEIYSYGHRNPQGLALDRQGQIWSAEHGARGGDEVNRIEAGRNYGWPIISYGRHYTGFTIGEGTHKAGMEQPRHYWDPSIAPSGMMVYGGKMFPQWAGDIFVGSLKFDYISRLRDDGGLTEVEQLASDETLRVRDVREAPDGSIWFLSVGNGTLYRISR